MAYTHSGLLVNQGSGAQLNLDGEQMDFSECWLTNASVVEFLSIGFLIRLTVLRIWISSPIQIRHTSQLPHFSLLIRFTESLHTPGIRILIASLFMILFFYL